jgi:hypothetical protein
MGNNLLYIDRYESDICALKSETAWISSCLDERIDAVSDSFSTVQADVEACKERIDELFRLLRPVLDAQADRPKQKWLWEIFEPNDIEIDFPYNI